MRFNLCYFIRLLVRSSVICFITSSFAFSQIIEKIDDSHYQVNISGKALPGSKYFGLSAEGKKVALFEITSSAVNGKTTAKLIKGNPQIGLRLLAANKKLSPRIPAAQTTQTELKSEPYTSPFSVQALLISGNGSFGTTSNLDGTTTAATAAISGFAVGLSGDYWINHFSIGGDFRFNSLEVKSSGVTGSSTNQELSLTAGYLIDPINVHLKATATLFTSGATAATGVGFGAKYFFTPHIAVLGEYKTVTYGASTDGSTAAKIDMFNIGGSFSF